MPACAALLPRPGRASLTASDVRELGDSHRDHTVGRARTKSQTAIENSQTAQEATALSPHAQHVVRSTAAVALPALVERLAA